MTPDPPPEKPPWELKTKWVVLTAVVMWAFGAVGLLVYLLGPKVLP